MGATSSFGQNSKLLKSAEADVVKLMMPVYYSLKELSIEERRLAKSTWDLIVHDKSPEFLSNKGKPGFHCTCCVSFFYDSFYTRLFDIHPMSRQLFVNGMKSQGKFLVKMIGLALSETELCGVDIFEKTLHHLTTVHFERGVKAVEYGIVGEVLFWSLQRVLGPEYFTEEVRNAWVKVYNRLIRTIVPVAVGLELHGYKHKCKQASTPATAGAAVGGANDRDASVSYQDFCTASISTNPATNVHSCLQNNTKYQLPLQHHQSKEEEEEEEEELIERLEHDAYVSSKSYLSIIPSPLIVQDYSRMINEQEEDEDVAAVTMLRHPEEVFMM